jgi:hypothetical protein
VTPCNALVTEAEVLRRVLSFTTSVHIEMLVMVLKQLGNKWNQNANHLEGAFEL